MKNHVSVVKITRPSVSGILDRERLFRLLDDKRQRPVVWVSGPAGSGKTTLVASYLDARNLPCLWYIVDEGDADIATFFYYMGRAAEKESAHDRKPLPLLTPEYLQSIPTFTKRYFENLCGRLKPPFSIFLDNYQDASPESDFHDMIASGLDVVPPGINIIILSRHEPPQQFARLRANNKISFIGWNEIRFTFEESREILRLYGQENVTDEALEELYGKTEGWMAGLVLFVEGTKRAGIDPAALSRLVPEAVFDYFATEIFERTDVVIREFLLKTSFLPSMTPQMAEKLTGVPASAEILSQLFRSHYFIEMQTSDSFVYHYHPLFREFLQSKMKNMLRPEETISLLRNAAGLLEESGQIEHAVFLLRDARDWEGIVSMILKQAGPLTAQGRWNTLQRWLASLPEEIVEETPWLLYWKGICSMPFNLIESRDCLDRAFQIFRREKDPAGLYLSWSGIVDTFVYEGGFLGPLDRWIAEFEGLRLEYSEFPSHEIGARATMGIMCALKYRQTDHPDLPAWANRLEKIVLGSRDIRLQTSLCSHLILYHVWWTGDLSKAKFLIEALTSSIDTREVDPLSMIVWRVMKVPYYWLTADYEKCMEAVNEGLAMADETGIHVWDFMLSGLGAAMNVTDGNPGEALKFINRTAAAINHGDFLKTAYYYFFAGFLSLYQGDLNAAYESLKNSMIFCQKSGSPFYIAHGYFALGFVLLERDQREEGLAYITKAKETARAIHCTTAEYLSLISEAWFFLRKGEEEPGLEALKTAMTIGRQHGFMNNTAWRPDLMSFLCAKALENGIETEYVRELIKKRKLTPPGLESREHGAKGKPYALALEEWPWHLKIDTLGRFEIIIDDKPLEFSGKVQQKPLSLLKAIIAHGGRDIGRQQLMDALWPDADGAQAHKSFEIALHRLRRLLGYDKAVLLNEGMVMLDPRRCWVDIFAFEHIIGQAEVIFQGKPGDDSLKRIAEFADKILSMYNGQFLEREAEQSWTVSLRERLHAKFLNSIVRSCRLLEAGGQDEKAIECLEKALERDNLYEEFYQQIMVCYHKLGRPAAAEEVYRRCRTVLSAILGSEPSPRTEEIYSRTNPKR